MEWLVVLCIGVGWYASGAVGSIMVFEALRRSPTWRWDVTVGDCIFGLLIAILGPFNLFFGVIAMSAHAFGKRVNTSRVVFPRSTH